MAFLPDKHRSTPPQQWVPRSESSGFLIGLLLYAVLAVASLWLLWPWLVDPVGPNFESWGNRNHTGVTPRDAFGLAPRGGDGQDRPCSPYHPTHCGRDGGR